MGQWGLGWGRLAVCGLRSLFILPSALCPSSPQPIMSATESREMVPSASTRPRHQCLQCDRSYTRRNKLNEHMRAQHSGARFDCLVCERSFPNAAKLERHTCVVTLVAQPVTVPVVSDHQAARSDDPLVPAQDQQEADELQLPSTGQLLSQPAIDAGCRDFLEWLAAPPVFPMEQTLKRGLPTASTTEQTRTKLRQVVQRVAVLMPELMGGSELKLNRLIHRDVVQALIDDMVRCELKAGSQYPVGLLLKKVAIWLSCTRTRQAHSLFTPDQMFPDAWALINRLCRTTTRQRKRDSRAKKIRGRDQEESMSSAEMSVVLSACLRVLQRMQVDGRERELSSSSSSSSSSPSTLSEDERKEFTDHLIVALFILGLAPRPETFRGLKVSSVRPPGYDQRCPDQYVLDGEHGKTEMEYYMPVPHQLTSAVTYYLGRVIPMGHEGALFLQRNEEPRVDFSYVTRALTERYIGRPINASKFRMSVITDLRSQSGTDAMALAQHLGHSLATQNQHYVGVEWMGSASGFQSKLMQGVVM